MAGRKAGSPSRSEFIRKHLTESPDLKLAEVNEAWKKAGHSGEITASLFYQVKPKVGNKAPGRRGRPKKEVHQAAPASPSRNGSLNLVETAAAFVKVAGSIDHAITTLEALRTFGR